LGKLAFLRAEFGGDQSEQTPGLLTNEIGERLSKAVRIEIDLNLCFEWCVLGVDSLWGDCMFIPADWGS
jgi:hypothetical protein